MVRNRLLAKTLSKRGAAGLLALGLVLATGVVMYSGASVSRADAGPSLEWQNTGVSQVAVGETHTCAIEEGVLFCWGGDSQGQLGYDSLSDELTAVRVSPNTSLGFHNLDVTAVSAGGAVTCAIEGGVLFCWGANSTGQLGIGTVSAQESTVRKVSSGPDGFVNDSVSSVSVTGSGVCAIRLGVVYCWGANGLGAVGNGVVTDVSNPHPRTPRKVVDNGDFVNSGVTSVTRGLTTCAIRNGEVFCWGAGSSGQIGNGTVTLANSRPLKVSSGSNGFANNNVESVTSTGVSVCAVRSESGSRVMYCWGSGGYGNFGNGTQTIAQSTPTKVSNTGGMTNASVTSHHVGNASCAVDSGSVFCFGSNGYGQVGDGTITQRTSPTEVSNTGSMANANVTMVDTETDHACAIEGGSVYCWGRAANGRLGNAETTPDRLVPVPAAIPPAAPTAPTVEVGSQSLTVRVNPSDSGGTASLYTVTVMPGDHTCTARHPATACTIVGLTGGTTYTVTTTGTNGGGSSASSAPVTQLMEASPVAVDPTSPIVTSPAKEDSSGGGAVADSAEVADVADKKPATNPRSITARAVRLKGTTEIRVTWKVTEGDPRTVRVRNVAGKKCVKSRPSSCTFTGLGRGRTFRITLTMPGAERVVLHVKK